MGFMFKTGKKNVSWGKAANEWDIDLDTPSECLYKKNRGAVSLSSYINIQEVAKDTRKA